MNKSVVFGVIAVVILALAGGGFYLLQNLDGIVKDLMEDVGSDVLNTELKVTDVKLDLREGSATISGMSIANPEGFSPGSLFEMDLIKVAIDTGSLTGPVYVINEVTVDGIKVVAEQQGTGTNVQALMDGMDSGPEVAGESADAESGQDVLLAVKAINFANGSMALKSQAVGDLQVELPAFKIRNLGSADSGLTPDELGAAISTDLLKQVQKAVGKAIEKMAKDKAEDTIKKKLGDKLGGLFGGKDD